MENSAQVKVDIEVVESLLQPENREMSSEYILKHSTTRGSNIFQLFDTIQKPKHFVASRRRWMKSQGKSGAQQESWQHELRDIEYFGVIATSPPCPERTLKTPLPQQSPPSFREEEGRWVLMEDTRRRGFAFEKLAKRMLRFLEKSEKVKVGISELQERREVPVQIGISTQQVAQQGRSENGQKIFEVFWQEEEVCVASWPGGMRS